MSRFDLGKMFVTGLRLASDAGITLLAAKFEKWPPEKVNAEVTRINRKYRDAVAADWQVVNS